MSASSDLLAASSADLRAISYNRNLTKFLVMHYTQLRRKLSKTDQKRRSRLGHIATGPE
jgi:hypothetical protein